MKELDEFVIWRLDEAIGRRLVSLVLFLVGKSLRVTSFDSSTVRVGVPLPLVGRNKYPFLSFLPEAESPRLYEALNAVSVAREGDLTLLSEFVREPNTYVTRSKINQKLQALEDRRISLGEPLVHEILVKSLGLSRCNNEWAAFPQSELSLPQESLL